MWNGEWFGQWDGDWYGADEDEDLPFFIPPTFAPVVLGPKAFKRDIKEKKTRQEEEDIVTLIRTFLQFKNGVL